MDLGELLAYKPRSTNKRDVDDDEEEVQPPPRKLVRKDQELTDEEKLQLLQSLDDEDDEPGEQLDAAAVKRLLLSFEKHILKNQEMRIKFPDQPKKFMESELELNDEIQKLHVIATVPEHYPILVETNSVQSLVGLLSHDNSDISIAVVDLLQELTDVDTVSESEEEVEQLIDVLLGEQIVAQLVQNMERLDEKVKEDGDGVHTTLAIIENLCEFKNEAVTAVVGEQGLLMWLLRRVKVRAFDPNKLYASEILAILLQANESNQQYLGEHSGIDILLQSLAYYKRRDPQSSDETEMIENLFDCLCSSLMHIPNREKFLKGEGLQLMILMLKEKKYSCRSALKVLNHAMCTVEGRGNCVKFVEVYGLRSLFPAFMRTLKKAKKGASAEVEYEEHTTSIIASLLKNCVGAVKDRVISKFLENDHEKVDRLLELHLKYLQQVRDIEETIRKERRYRPVVENDETLLEDYLRRLDAGLFTLQCVDYIVMELCLCDIASIRARVQTILGQRGESLEIVREVMEEYCEQQEEGEGREHVTLEKQKLRFMIDELVPQIN